MRQLLILGVGLVPWLAAPAVGSELQRSPTPSLHEVLWPLSRPGSVFPSARIARQSKPEDVLVSTRRDDFNGRFGGQEPNLDVSSEKNKADRAALPPPSPGAASGPPTATTTDKLRVLREPKHEPDESLKRSDRAGRRAVLSICDGCVRGSRSVVRGTVPREDVGEDGLAYRAEDLR
jgi:hypothetical protein